MTELYPKDLWKASAEYTNIFEHVIEYSQLYCHRYIEFIDAIPNVPSGKILRSVLLERERSREAQDRE
jgi:acyl-CoA synthetase (AMP-forming)/AMP-acid ligase II